MDELLIQVNRAESLDMIYSDTTQHMRLEITDYLNTITVHLDKSQIKQLRDYLTEILGDEND